MLSSSAGQGFGFICTQPGRAAASVTLDRDMAWKLFARGLSTAQARPRAQVLGEETLALAALQLATVLG